MINLKVNGVQTTISKLANTKAKLNNTTVPMRKALIDIFKFVQRNFETQGGAHDLDSAKYGSKWKPLSPETIKRRARRKRKGKARKGILAGNVMILQETGGLKQKWDFLLSAKKGTLKSRSRYSRIHEYGGVGPMGQRIPQRKILPGKKDATAIVKKHFDGHVKVSIK